MPVLHPGRETVPAGDEADPAWLAHLYLCRGLSTYAIGELTRLDRQRVTRMLRRARMPLRRDDPPGLRQLLTSLYEEGRLGSPQIAAITGIPERTVRDRLRRYGIVVRTRGGSDREDRRTVPAEILDDLYTRLGLTADEVGRKLGTTRNTVLRSAHALGVPVRAGGVVPLSGPEEIELVKDLYWGCGAGLTHIELLTGQSAMSVRGFMRRAGIPLRHPGGRTPFLRRWRASRQPDSASRTGLRSSGD